MVPPAASSSTGPVRVVILGPVEVRCDGRPVEVAGGRLRALLARLALDPGRPVTTAALGTAVWDAEPPADEVNALQSLVSRLRRALGRPGLVQQSGAGYLLDLPADAVDAVRFETLVRDGRRSLRAGDPAAAAATLREAHALWRGEPAAGVGAGDAARLTELHLDATGDRVEADLALGMAGDLVAELEALATAYPLRERFAGQLMAALAGSGRQADALAVYAAVRERLAQELGVDPSAGLRDAHLAVLRGVPAAAPAAAPASQREERTNLRSGVTSFLGRDADLALVGSLLAAGRLVTVLGPGGAGKTRLAVEAAARQLDATADGVWFVELAPVTDPAEVAHAVLAAVGLREAPRLDRREPRPPREAVERLLDLLADRDCLLVIDNCEHLVDAAARLVDTLLARCPRLRVLTTSREPLGIAGEALVPLPSLATPPQGTFASAAAAYPSVQLFAERAAAVRPGFEVGPAEVADVVEIVGRLDGLPLAIELAAARLRTLPVQEIAARLSDRFRLLTGGSRTALPRHRTLRAVVDWSWDLLTPAERLLAERIAVFPAGVTADTAAGVCDPGPVDVGELLAALVDRSLLQLVDGVGARYRMLETIREYGTDRLAERGELAGMRRAHAAYFARLAATADPLLRGPQQLTWLRTLDAEHDNLLAALRTLCDLPEPAAAAQLALDLSWYWTMTDRHAEAATWLRIVLDRPGGLDPVIRTVAAGVHAINGMAAREFGRDDGGDPRETLVAAAAAMSAVDDSEWPTVAVLKPALLFFLGDTDGSAALLEQGTRHPDPWARASTRALRARFAENEGDLVLAREDSEVAAAAFRELGDSWGLASVLPLTAQLRLYDGDPAGALAAMEEAERLLVQVSGTDASDGLLLAVQLANIRYRVGDVDLARATAAQACRLAEARGAPELMVVSLALAGTLERAHGDLGAARRLQQRADDLMPEAVRRAFGADHGLAIVSACGARLDLAEGDPQAATDRLTAGYAAARASRDKPVVAMVAVAVAALADDRGLAVQGTTVLGAAARLRGADDPTAPDIADLAARLRTVLGPAAYQEAWDAGRALSPADALDAVDPARLDPVRLDPARLGPAGAGATAPGQVRRA